MTMPPGSLRRRLATELLREADRDIILGRQVIKYI